MSRDEDIETICNALCHGKACARDCADADHTPCDDSVCTWREDAERILTALEASGMAVVPREPTEAMVDAGGSSIIRPSVYMGGVPPGAKRRARDIWADMLAASPTPSMTENADE